MNKRIDFSHLGGFPATQYMTEYMQSSYRSAFMALAGMIGDKVIITGVEIVGGQVTNGWISFNGELLPFIGGLLPGGAEVAIVESSETRVFNDNNSHEVYFKREAKIGTPGSFPFSDLKRIGTLKEVWQSRDIKMVDVDAAYVAANFDNTGLGINERKGWAICNGNNGTVNRGGKFPIGYNPANADYATLLAAIGEEFKQLTIANMPRHNHTGFTANGGDVPAGSFGLIKKSSPGNNGTPGAVDSNNSGTEPLVNVSPVDIPYQGTAEQFKIVPPAVITLFIMKL